MARGRGRGRNVRRYLDNQGDRDRNQRDMGGTWVVGLKTQDNFIHSSRSSLCQLSFKYIRIQILLLGKACVETENSSSNLKSIHFNNTPEHELGSPKLFENELIDPLATVISISFRFILDFGQDCTVRESVLYHFNQGMEKVKIAQTRTEALNIQLSPRNLTVGSAETP